MQRAFHPSYRRQIQSVGISGTWSTWSRADVKSWSTMTMPCELNVEWSTMILYDPLFTMFVCWETISLSFSSPPVVSKVMSRFCRRWWSSWSRENNGINHSQGQPSSEVLDVLHQLLDDFCCLSIREMKDPEVTLFENFVSEEEVRGWEFVMNSTWMWANQQEIVWISLFLFSRCSE